VYAGPGFGAWHAARGVVAETGLRVVLVSYRSEAFAAMSDACTAAGATVVACACGRPALRDAVDVGSWLSAMSSGLPGGTDLLFPASARGLGRAVAGYRPDLMVVCGLNWRLPADVLDEPRLGVLNIHPSALPKYRGPQPLLRSVLNGDTEFGVTIHRMDEQLDTGPIIAQRLGLPLHDHITEDNAWAQLADAIWELLPGALARVADGYAGEPQDDSEATYAAPVGPEFDVVDSTQTVAQVHNLVRAHRFAMTGRGPLATVDGRRYMVLATSLTEVPGIRIDCADGSLWIVDGVLQAGHDAI
jgi:methionyl-tRNA formyltransferase